ncbi:MAG: homoserine dehydrogenase [Ruminococcaceae bacterium]|nr:homoserine dehydrogenase [Oscillospiraceae bacterium]
MTNIAILGFGVVGSGIAEVITQNSEIIKNKIGDEINIKYILDLREFPDSPFADKIVHDFNIILNDDEVSIVAEAMGGLHPAFDFSEQALKKGKSVVTSNKHVVAEKGDVLLKTAAENGVRYLFEASVGGGIPVLRPLGTCLAANKINEINGILNGTTNYILTQMIDFGKTFEVALKEAQMKGYAEANPTADVDGIDACRKICILAAIAFGKLINPSEVSTVGISNIRLNDVKNASEAGYAIKLIGQAKDINGKMSVSVAPRLVPNTNLLSKVDDVFNGILVNGNASDDIIFIGKGAGKMPTASAVVADIVDIAGRPEIKNQQWAQADKNDLVPSDDVVSAYYVCTTSSEDAVKSAFNEYSALSLKDGEFSFITPAMKKSAFNEMASKIDVISSFEIL